MLKHLILAAAIACAAPALTAQTAGSQPTTRTITGMVVDKNGNPLSGAEVRATGGAETVYTEADGSYSIEVPVTLKSLTASYTGLKDRKLKITGYNNMIFSLKPYNNTHGFVNFVGGASKVLGGKIPVDGMIPQLGLMGGAYRSWGGYAKVVLGVGGPKIDDGSGYSERFTANPVITGGVIKRLTNNVNLLVGAGAGANYNIYGYGTINYIGGQVIDDYSYVYPECDWAPAVELGVMYHYRKINIIAGLTYMTPCFDKDDYFDSWGDVNGEHSTEWYVDNDNNGNLNFFISVGLHF